MGIAVDENGNLYIGDSGNNVIRQVSYAPETLTFAAEPIGATSAYQLVSPFNVGNQALNMNTISLTSDFQQVTTGLSDCAPGTVLTPGSLCNTAVSFAPVHVGAIAGSASLASNSLNNSAALSTVNLNGTGSAGAGPYVSLSPSRAHLWRATGGHDFAIANGYVDKLRRQSVQYFGYLPFPARKRVIFRS